VIIMAVVDNITSDELSPKGVSMFRCQLTGATSTITKAHHKFGRVLGAIINVEGTNTMTWTRSTTTLTVTGTEDDWVNCIVWGIR
jgi:hypothetical protein